MEKEAICEGCQAMLDKGIVEYSDSPWSAPVVLVKKKDGKWRFRVNFTATVNPHLIQDSEPLDSEGSRRAGGAGDGNGYEPAGCGKWLLELCRQERA